MSMSYSSVYGNKIRKLWKLLAKNDMLTSNSYEFDDPRECKVKDCNFKVTSVLLVMQDFIFQFQAKTAMEIFRHIRESHLTEIKKLRIKIGQPPQDTPTKPAFRKPGPRSRTRINVSDETASEDINHPSCSNYLTTNEEKMDFESAIDSILSERCNTEHEIVLTNDDSKVTFETKL